MPNETKRKGLWLGLLLALIAVVSAVIYSVQQRKSHISSPDEYVHRRTQGEQTLSDVIAHAKTWGPVYQTWYGQQASNFTLSDLAGKPHTLSDYRGRNVMLVFWATWCAPCVMEVPHLVELRKTVSPDDLAILAISYIDPRNTEDAIKLFVKADPEINYTILPADIDQMPEPFDSINAIPSSFFIDREGKIKLATSGLLSLADMKAIINAK